MANKKIYAAMSGTAIATVIASALSTTALAKSTDVLVQGKDNNQYQYNIEDLVDSFIGDKVLYNDFIQRGEAKAYYDDVIKGYVDVEKIVDEYTDNSDTFDLDKFTESVKETSKVDGNIDKVSEKDGKVIVESKKEPVKETIKVESVGAIDETTVKVTFDTKIDKVSKENFKISGVEVTDVLQDQDGKTVTISIDNYMPHDAKISFNGIKVNGEDVQLTDKYIDNSTRSSIELKANKDEVMVYSDKANEPVEITVNVNKLPKDSEATLEFSTTFGQIVKQE